MKNLFLTTALMVAACSLAAAQPGSGGPAPGAAPTETPIDGGASLLLAGGMGYALKQLRARRARRARRNPTK